MAMFFSARECALRVAILCATLFLAYGQAASEPRNCTPEAAFLCYDAYRLELKGAQALADEGNYQEALDQKCKRIKDKLPCHKELALCPETTRSNFTVQERGYQAVSDIICDAQALKDSYVAGRCQDPTNLIDCLVEWTFRTFEDDPPRDDNTRLCRRLQGSSACYQETFVASSCPVTLELAEPAFTRTQKALVELVGCHEPNRSTPLSSTPQGLLLGMLVLSVVRWITS
nr:uncharacterized protein LOC119163213 [Rhipicephalus microplus]